MARTVAADMVPRMSRTGSLAPCPSRAVRRRTAVGLAAAGAVALGGCRIDPPADRTDEASPAGSRDTEVVAAAVAQIREVVSTLGSDDGVGAPPWVASLLTLHREHLALLEPAVPRADDAATATTPGTVTSPSLQQVRRAELKLQRHLASAAGQASSGDLARVLACASAGVAQAVTVIGGAA